MDIVVDVTFDATTKTEYDADVTAFQNNVDEMVSVNISLLEISRFPCYSAFIKINAKPNTTFRRSSLVSSSGGI